MAPVLVLNDLVLLFPVLNGWCTELHKVSGGRRVAQLPLLGVWVRGCGRQRGEGSGAAGKLAAAPCRVAGGVCFTGGPEPRGAKPPPRNGQSKCRVLEGREGAAGAEAAWKAQSGSKGGGREL